MRTKIMSKVSVALLACMLFNMSLPLLSFAASYYKLSYDSVSGQVYGVVYSDNNSVELSVYGDGDTNGFIIPTGEAHETEHGFFYNIFYEIAKGLHLDKFLIDGDEISSYCVKKVVYGEVYDTVYGNIYNYHPTDDNLCSISNEPTDPETIWYYPYLGDNNESQVYLSWEEVQNGDIVGYKIFVDGEEVAYTSNTYVYLTNFEYLTEYAVQIAAVNSVGFESPRQLTYSIISAGVLQGDQVPVTAKKSGSNWEKGQEIVKFSPLMLNHYQYSPNGSSNITLVLNSVYDNLWGKGFAHHSYQVNEESISMDDFELYNVDDDEVIPVTGLQIYNENGYLDFTLHFDERLDSGDQYILRMSNTSSGDEIHMPDANVNNGEIQLIVNNYLDSNYFYFNSLVIGDGEAPSKPNNLFFIEKDGEVVASWSPNSEADIKGYLVYVDGNLITETPITDTSFSIKGLTNGKKYHVNVAAVDNIGHRSLQAFGFPTPHTTSAPSPTTTVAPPAQSSPDTVKVLQPEDLKPANGEVSISVENNHDQVLLPATAAALTGNTVKISNKALSAEIPNTLIDQLKTLVPADQLKDAQISFSFEKKSNEEANKALNDSQAKLNNTTLKAAGEIYEFTLSITTKDGKDTKLSTFDKPIKLKLKLAEGAKKDLVGVYYLGSDGKLEYVGGQLTDDGYIIVEVSHFSTYAVLEFQKSFKDVAANYWAADAISKLAAKHVINGTTDTTFAPEKKISRAEFTAYLVRKLNLKADGSSSFKDVTSGKWYADAIAAAEKAGIVSGKTATTFAPEASITRQEMTVILMKAYMYSKGINIDSFAATTTFADHEEIDKWAAPYIQEALKLGLIKGRGNNNFVPNGFATRAEAAQVVSMLE